MDEGLGDFVEDELSVCGRDLVLGKEKGDVLACLLEDVVHERRRVKHGGERQG